MLEALLDELLEALLDELPGLAGGLPLGFSPLGLEGGSPLGFPSLDEAPSEPLFSADMSEGALPPLRSPLLEVMTTSMAFPVDAVFSSYALPST